MRSIGARLRHSAPRFLDPIAHVVTSGTPLAAPGRLATEEDRPTPVMPRRSEQASDALTAQGVRSSVVRLPQVHDTVKQGLVSYLIAVARDKGVSAYVGEGLNRWPAVHRLDAAPIYRLAIEKGTAGSCYHAIAEEGVPLREIAEAIGRGLKIPAVSISPEEAGSHFGWLGFFAGSTVLLQAHSRRNGWDGARQRCLG